MRNVGDGSKDTHVLWIYINMFDEDGAIIRNKVMSIGKTVVVEEKFVIAQKYVDNMLGKML